MVQGMTARADARTVTREPETCVRITGRPAASASPPLNGSWPGRAYVGRPYANPMAELPGVCLDDLGPLLAGLAGVGRSAPDRVRRARA
jgi:hypothetical protein